MNGAPPSPERPAADAPPRLSLFANVRWGLLGNVVYSAAQWVQFAILARLGGLSAVGSYAYALALAAPAFALANLQLRTLQVSDTRGAAAFGEYRRLRIATTVAAVAVVVGTSMATGEWGGLWPLLVPVCAMRTADALADIYNGVWQQAERVAMANAGMMLNGIASVVFMAVAAWTGGGAPGAAAGSALGSMVALAFIHVSTGRDRHLRAALAPWAPPRAWAAVARLGAQAVPLGLIVLLIAMQQNAPRYFIRHYGGDAALGMFAAASQLTAAGTLVVSAVGFAVSPRLARFFQAGDRAGFMGLTRRATLACAALGGAGVLLSLAAGRWVLTAVYRAEFAAAAGVLVVLSVAAALGFATSLLGYALTAGRALATQTYALGASLVMLVAACAVLVPRHGAMGAAWGVVAASAVQLVANALTMRRLVLVPPARSGAPSESRARQAAS